MIANNTIKNTQFDNLVNYEAALSNSSLGEVSSQSSADPNSLSSLLKNAPLIEFSFAITPEHTEYAQTDKGCVVIKTKNALYKACHA